MKKHFDKMVGQVVALHTDKGIEIGVVEAVSDKGVTLKPLAKKDRNGLDVEHVFWGGGYYPYSRFYGYAPYGYGYRPYGYGYRPYGYGYGYRPFYGYGAGVGVGVGVGIGAGFGSGFFW